MATLRLHPQGDYEVGTMVDDTGETFCMLVLPDNRTGHCAELVFDLASFVTFADWVTMIAEQLLRERQSEADPE